MESDRSMAGATTACDEKLFYTNEKEIEFHRNLATKGNKWILKISKRILSFDF